MVVNLLETEQIRKEKNKNFRLVTSAGWNDVLDPLMSQVRQPNFGQIH